jgi:hypothetical protein
MMTACRHQWRWRPIQASLFSVEFVAKGCMMTQTMSFPLLPMTMLI